MMFCLWCVRSSPRKDQDNNPAACQLEEEDLCSNGGEQEVKPITQGISASSGLRKISATSLTKVRLLKKVVSFGHQTNKDFVSLLLYDLSAFRIPRDETGLV